MGGWIRQGDPSLSIPLLNRAVFANVASGGNISSERKAHERMSNMSSLQNRFLNKLGYKYVSLQHAIYGGFSRGPKSKMASS